MTGELRSRAIRRRELLELVLAGLGTPLWLRAGAAAGLIGCADGNGSIDATLVLPDPESLPESAALSVDYFADRDAAAIEAIGLARLRQLGDTAEPFEETLAILDAATEAGDAVMRLQQAVQQDFEQRRVVRVEGWILSRTEADCCALFTAFAE